MDEIATTKLTIINDLGLHARAATLLVQTASKYQADLYVSKDGRQINGKSIMGVLLLTAGKGTELEVEAIGADCKELIAAIEDLVKNKFGEDK
ncbi:MAG: HPr family phosphocarrier protein [Deltaproteobacteria bacterium]|nr:HPr family phosphocarrier protein [Deltaproteobacteria bacterium]MBN2671163.1 HPr family phosphocarrier protein [Deltaproteobacteria bacterium]